ncbi:MAG: phosphoglycolate phosphatase [Chloroflexi bacterium]|nr:phosphoglycolate phosphatase [Chloroflexota bacterium]
MTAAKMGMDVHRRPTRRFDGYVFDLDGTLYLGDHLLPGAADTVAAIRAAGARVAFLTNKPLELPSAYAQKLTALGIPATAHEVISSTDSLLLYLAREARGATILPIGEPLIGELLRGAGFATIDPASDDPTRADLVVVSWDRTFDYPKLVAAFRAVRAGARIVATNPDPFCPTPDGDLPDCAAMLAAIEASTGARAEAIVGKPSAHMAAALLDRLALSAEDTVLVGDRLTTDVRMAREAGMASALVLTGARPRLRPCRRRRDPAD